MQFRNVQEYSHFELSTVNISLFHFFSEFQNVPECCASESTTLGIPVLFQNYPWIRKNPLEHIPECWPRAYPVLFLNILDDNDKDWNVFLVLATLEAFNVFYNCNKWNSWNNHSDNFPFFLLTIGIPEYFAMLPLWATLEHPGPLQSNFFPSKTGMF